MSAASVLPNNTLDIILDRLAARGTVPVHQRIVGGYRCDCPVGHLDSAGSLQVREAKDGRIVLNCREGCHQATVAAALGMGVQELFPRLDSAAPTIALADDSERLPRSIRAIDAPPAEPITWCIDELLVAGELAVCAGDGGSYKTTCAVHMAGAVAGGYAAFNRFRTARRAALIVSAEDSAGVLLNRLDALVAGHGWDRSRVLNNVHLLATHAAKLSDPAWQQHLVDECARLDVGYVLFDPWADLIDGEENSNSEQRPVIQFCRRVATQTTAAVVVNAHAAKAKDGQRAIDRVRGASALRDAARCVLFFESRPEGIAVEHLKMSRSEKLAPFILTREIESTAESRAIWASARFSFQESSTATLSRAESFVLDQVTASPGVLLSTDLKVAARDSAIRGEDINKALNTLQARGLIDYDRAPRNGKRWRLGVQSSRSTRPGPTRENESVQSVQSRSNLLQLTPRESVQSVPPTGGTPTGADDRGGPTGSTRPFDDLELLELGEWEDEA